MRALGLVLAAIGCTALLGGCGDSTAGEKQRDPDPVRAVEEPQAKPPAPKQPAAPPMAVAEPAAEPAVEEQADAEQDTAGEDLKPGEVELVETDGISLLELAIARGVEERKAIDVGQEFSIADGTKLYAYMLLSNPDSEEGQQVRVFWQQEGGKERGGVAVTVGAQPKWRTWAFHGHVNKPGKWQAIVRNAEDQVIGRAPFVVTD